MRSYIVKYLLKDEKILFRTHRHWIVFWPSMVWLAFAFLLKLIPIFNSTMPLIFLGITALNGFFCFIDFAFSEIAVTNKRVIVKVGWLSRQSLETNLKNIASIGVSQSLLGRLLGYGSINIFDTGQVMSSFDFIYRPFDFRQHVQSQIDR